MISVKEIAFTGYPVTDLARARAFYEGVLGLKITKDFEHEGRHWIEYDIGPGTLAITNMWPEWKPSYNGPSLALEVEDFDAAVADLRAAGIKFTVEPMNGPICRMTVIHDTEGNSLVIHKHHAG